MAGNANEPVSTTARVQISKAFVSAKMEEGYSKETIRETWYPSINANQWNRAIKAMNLNKVRAKKVDYAISDEYVEPCACESTSCEKNETELTVTA